MLCPGALGIPIACNDTHTSDSSVSVVITLRERFQPCSEQFFSIFGQTS